MKETVAALGHDNGVPEGKVDAPGYTGDLVCGVCGDMIKKGEDIPALEVKIENGVYYVDGAFYYVNDNGKIVANNAKFYVTKTNDLVTCGFHAFDADSMMVE